jgi:hypothetical protein
VGSSRRPSFLKRQKEQARLARAAEKREARLARKHAKANRPEGVDPEMLDDDLMGVTDDDAIGEGEESDEPGEPDETPH